MAGAFVTEIATGGSISTATTTGTITVSGATANNLLIACLGMKGGSDVITTEPTGWTKREFNTSATSGTNACNGVTYERIATGDSNDNFSASWTNAKEWAITIGEFSGLDATSPFETSAEDSTYHNTDQTGAGTISSGSVAPTTQPGMAISCFFQADERDGGVGEMSDASGGFTVNAEHRPAAGNNEYVAIASRTYTDTGSRECVWDSSISTGWKGYANVHTYKEPAAGGGPALVEGTHALMGVGI